MTTQEKYDKLRAACVALVGVDDDKGNLLMLTQTMNGMQLDKDGEISLKLIVALIETHDDVPPELHPAQRALRKIRARAESGGTSEQHSQTFAEGMRCAANILEAAINRGNEQ